MRVLFAWELGAGLGHVLPLFRIGDRVEQGSGRVLYALADVSASPNGLGERVILQAPICKRQLAISPYTPETFADVLLQAGYGSARVLASLLVAWRSLLKLAGPDVIVADFAPTALLAANGMGIPSIAIGTGFCNPPDSWPSFEPGESISTAALMRKSDVEKAIKEAYALVFGSSPAEPLKLLRARETLLTCWKELDHYARQGGVRYVGPVVDGPSAENGITWRGNHRKILMYLKPEMQTPTKLLAAATQLHDTQIRDRKSVV